MIDAREMGTGDVRTARGATTVWLVDDNGSVREMIAELLGGDSAIHLSRQFGSAKTMLAALAEESGPDLLLLDVNLGAESGLDAIRPARELSPKTRVAMITTFYDSHAERTATQAGASAFLLKAELQEGLKELLAPSASTRNSPEISIVSAAAPQRRYRLERLLMLRHLFGSLRSPAGRRTCSR